LKFANLFLCALLPLSVVAQNEAAKDLRKNGTSFLSKQLQELQADTSRNPVHLWIERGQTLWQAQCISCHGDIASVKSSVTTFPKLNADNKLVNLEDHIEKHKQVKLSSDEVLALSAALHDAAKGERIQVKAIAPHYQNGERLWNTRMGRINLACMHCHDQKVGANMRADVVSQGHPTGFPIYRLTWQNLGSIDRRLRACYSGVQAPLPLAGAPELRDLELFLKVRANGMMLDGPSIRR
jgi:L-cysteine S-thiosulfotransferase